MSTFSCPGSLCHTLTPFSQVRFELAWKALDQNTKTIIPWRIPEFYERFASVNLSVPSLSETLTQTVGVKHSWTLPNPRAFL